MDIEDLTWREQEILTLLADRLTNREIALRLHLAESTVKDYVSRILAKLHAKNRRQAVVLGKEMGFLKAKDEGSHSPKSNFPVETTAFIGRQNDLAEISDLLKATRLLTLIGPGGVGKTRLALETAVQLADKFKNGSFFVVLASIDSSQDIAQTLAEALKYPLTSEEDPVLQLVRYLRHKEILLVVDNFEHLLDGAPLLAEILKGAPNVKFLVTSREKLNLRGETVFTVNGMTLPGHPDDQNLLNFDSIALFVYHARKSRPSFNPTPEQLQRILKICLLTEGFPLAIELAAAWLHMLSLDEIAAELDQSFDILSAQMRDAPKRHRSIQAVFDHTWSLLTPAERNIFRQLAVFRGGFNREAAAQVTGASLYLLGSLVSKSIIRYDSVSGRFGIHELLRQYAIKPLEADAKTKLTVYAAHAAYFAKSMSNWWSRLKNNQQIQALAEIEVDLENIRSAWRTHLDLADVPHLKMYTNTFWLIHWLRGWNLAAVNLFARGARSLETRVNEIESTALRARFQANQAFFLTWLGQAEQGYALSKESVRVLEQLEDFEGLIFAYNALTLAAYYLGRVSEEKDAADRLLSITLRSDDRWAEAFASALASMASLRMKEYDEAVQLARNCLEISSSIGDKVTAILANSTLGVVANQKGDLGAAGEIYHRFLNESTEIGFYWGIGNSTKYLAQINLKKGDISKAEGFFRQSLSIAVDLGLDRDIVNHLYEFAHLRIAQKRKTDAVILLAAILEQPASWQIRLESGRIRDDARKLLAQLETEIPPEAFAQSLNMGSTFNLEEAIAELLS